MVLFSLYNSCRKFLYDNSWSNNDGYSIVCEASSTKSGFKHVATLMHRGCEADEITITYLNRTWEKFEYQSAIHKLLDEASILTDKEKRRFRKKVK